MASTLNNMSPDGIGRVVHRAAEVEADVAAGEVIDDVARVGQRAREAVELGDHDCVAGAAGGERLPQPGRSRGVPVSPWST